MNRPQTAVPWLVLLLTMGMSVSLRASSVWAVGLSPGEAPQKLESNHWPRVAPTEWVLSDGKLAMAVVEAGSPVPRSLPHTRPLLLTVESAEKVPAGAIHVQWRPAGVPNLPEPFGRASTGKDGSVTVYTPPDVPIKVWIDEPGYLPSPARVAAGASVASLRLLPAKKRCIVVKGPFGRYLAHAGLVAVQTRSLTSATAIFSGISDTVEASSDAEGRLIPPPKSGALSGWIVAKCYLPKRVLCVRDLPNEVSLELAQSGTAAVVDSNTGEAIKNAKWSSTWSPRGVPWVRLSERGAWGTGKGAYYIPQYPCTFSVAAKGYIPRTFDLNGPSHSIPSKISLHAGITIEGAVVSPDGKPVPRATIMVGKWSAKSVMTASDKKGHFVLPTLDPSDGPVALLVTADGYAQTHAGPWPAKSRSNVVIRMSLGAVVTGSLVDKDTLQPVPDARVNAETHGQAFNTGNSAGSTLSDGSFRLQGLEPGNYTLHAYAPGYAAANRDFSVQAGAPADLGQILLDSSPHVTGSLTRGDGEDLSSGAKVWLERQLNYRDVTSPSGPTKLNGTIKKDGGFSVGGVPDGHYVLRASDLGLRATKGPFDVHGEDKDVGTVVLNKAATVTGSLVGNQDFTGWRVELLAQAFDPDPPTVTVSQDGSFDFGDVAPGSYRLSAYEPLQTVPKAIRPIDLQAGQDADVQIPIGGVTVNVLVEVDGQVASRASLKVRPPSSEAFDNGVIEVTSPNGRIILGLPTTGSNGQADATGVVTLTNAPTGPVQGYLYWNGMQYMAPFSIPSEPGGMLTFNFQGRTLQGVLQAVDGSPAAKVMVSLAYQGLGVSPGQSSRTDAAGHFTFKGLGSGTIVLTARDDAGDTARQDVTIEDNAAATPPVVLRLQSSGGAKSQEAP